MPVVQWRRRSPAVRYRRRPRNPVRARGPERGIATPTSPNAATHPGGAPRLLRARAASGSHAREQLSAGATCSYRRRVDLIVVHGPPGIGKRTISELVVRANGYGLFNTHLLASAFSPIFDWATPSFYALRDELYPIVVRRALAERADGLVMTFIFEPTVQLDVFQEFVDAADRSLFVGLTAAVAEHERRITDPARSPEKRWDNASGLADLLATGIFDFPPLPGPSVVLDTTGRTAQDSADEVLSLIAGL